MTRKYDWKKVKKGTGFIYKCDELSRAVYDNLGYGRNPGIFYDGIKYGSVGEAMDAAEKGNNPPVSA